jgi:hypothetical protein
MLSQQQVGTPPMVSCDPDRASRPVTETAMPKTQSEVPCAWRAAALETYALDTGVDGAHLRAELATRVSTLTGCAIPDSTIPADSAARRPTAMIDGVVFQLQGHTLVVLRHCGHCGTGFFESLPIESRSDLGYALGAWTPYHPDCMPTDPPDDASW